MTKKVTVFDEFKTFISRGNMADVAIAVIMGTAFTKLVNSFVSALISPLISVIMGHVKLAHLAFHHHTTVFHYGEFLQAAVNFLVLTIVVFFIVKTINSLRETVTGQHIVIKNEPSEKQLLKEIHTDLKTKVSKIEVKPATKHGKSANAGSKTKKKSTVSDEATK